MVYSVCPLSCRLGFDSESDQTNDFKTGPTKHRKELQDTENSAKNYKALPGSEVGGVGELGSGGMDSGGWS